MSATVYKFPASVRVPDAPRIAPKPERAATFYDFAARVGDQLEAGYLSPDEAFRLVSDFLRREERKCQQ